MALVIEPLFLHAKGDVHVIRTSEVISPRGNVGDQPSLRLTTQSVNHIVGPFLPKTDAECVQGVVYFCGDVASLHVSRNELVHLGEMRRAGKQGRADHVENNLSGPTVNAQADRACHCVLTVSGLFSVLRLS